ncbi:MAG: EAL domain-containing protein [Treponema sp.]|nr:EAL domain-containing protein [Treponema sp.]
MDNLIAFDLCSIIILSVLVFSLFARKMTHGKINRCFIVCVINLLFCSIADFVIIIAPFYFPITTFTFSVVSIVNYVYYITRILTPVFYVPFIVSLTGRWVQFVNNKKNLAVFFSVLIFSVILILFNAYDNHFFVITSDLKYHRCSYLYVIYIWAILLILFDTVYMIRYRKLLKPTKFFTVLLLIPVSFIGLVIQFFLPWISIEVFSSSFLLLVISIVVLQPKEMIDYGSGAFNLYAFEDTIRQNLISKRPMKLIYLKILNLVLLKYLFGSEKYKTLIQKMIKTIYSFREIIEFDVFNVENDVFIIVTHEELEDRVDLFLDRLSTFLSTEYKTEKANLRFDFLITLARCPQDFNNYEQVLNFSMKFDSIINKKNTITYYSKEALNRFFVIENNLDVIIKNAVIKNHFQMYYQPIYSIEKMRFNSAEALIRLIDDKYGFIPPGIFIPAAEDSGAIHKIGDYIFNEVFRFISSIDFEGLGLDYIELNLSVAQSIEPELPSKVLRLLNKYNIDPSKINIEITETSADEISGVSDKNIRELSESGVKFSLDDYGTGYSNLKRMTVLPFEIVKLDKVFVDEREKKDMEIVIDNTITMLKKLDKKVLIEGVETEEDLDTFVQAGCDYIQGYYFSCPLPEKDFLDFIKRNNKT